VKNLIGTTATLRFINVGDKPLAQGSKLRFIDAQTGLPIPGLPGEATQPSVPPAEPLVLTSSEVLYKPEDLVGFRLAAPEDLAVSRSSTATTEFPLSTAGTDVALELNMAAATRLASDSATSLRGNYLALVIDNQVKATLPVIQAITNGRLIFRGLAADPTFNMNELNGALSRVQVVNAGNTEPPVGQQVTVWNPMSGEPAPEIPTQTPRVDIRSDQVILTGDDFQSANVAFGQLNKPIIAFRFKSAAGQIFGRFTTQHVNQYLAISLDDTIISCPVIKSAILGGSGIIEGNFSAQEAQDLVIKLNSGRLPVQLQIIENRSIGPSLGQKSINESKRAAVAGAILVLLFMVLYYRFPGVLADVALMFYMLVFFGALSLLNATLTLPGIAGFVMSVGMAVDANVIIFERLKEELRAGKTFRSAIDAAFKRAFTAIFDSNITTIMAGLVLYNLGTGPIRGFAVTLTLGVLVSMFSALTFTRLLLESAMNNRSLQNYWLFGVKAPEGYVEPRGGEA
jgi:preprotein translocase subunit SecD